MLSGVLLSLYVYRTYEKHRWDRVYGSPEAITVSDAPQDELSKTSAQD